MATRDDPEGRGEARSSHRPIALLLAISALLGVICVLQFRSSPFSAHPVLDEASYTEWAEEIAGGALVGGDVFYQDPLYPYLLALLIALFGKSLIVVRFLQVVLGTASIAVVYWLGRKLGGERTGLTAAALLAGYGALYFFQLLILKATLVLFLSALACAAGVASAERPQQGRRWLALGAVLGTLTLLRGNFVALLPLALTWALLYERPSALRGRFGRAAWLGLGAALLILPVTLRNLAVGGELVLTTSQAGPNFYIGNHAEASGQYVAPPFVRAHPKHEASDYRSEAERRTGRSLSPAEVSRFWFAEALDWIRHDPARAAGLWLHKARLLVHQFEIPDNHSLYLTRRHFAPALKLPLLGFGLLWCPALLGMALVARRDGRAHFPVLFCLAYALSIIPFFILARYRMALVPGLCVFAALFLVWLGGAVERRQYAALGASTALVAAGLLIGLLPTREQRAPQGTWHFVVGNAYLNTGHPGEAMEWYARALDTQPGDPDILHNREVAQLRLDRTVLASLAELGLPLTRDQIRDLSRQVRGLSVEEIHELAGLASDDDDAPEPRGFARAAALYRLAAQRGHGLSQNNLGFFFEHGLGVHQDYAEAARWYRLSMQKRPIAGSQNNLGMLYYRGLGVPQSYREAEHWFRLAARQGHAPAQNNLGVLYHYGQGLPQDLASAETWYRRAAEQGYEEARKNLELLLGGQGVGRGE